MISANDRPKKGSRRRGPNDYWFTTVGIKTPIRIVMQVIANGSKVTFGSLVQRSGQERLPSRRSCTYFQVIKYVARVEKGIG